METKDELIINIKHWVKLDNEILALKNELKLKLNEKKQISDNLTTVMKTNSIDCFDISGGSIIYKKNTVKKSISKKLLLNALEQFFVNNDSADISVELTDYILNNREQQIKEKI